MTDFSAALAADALRLHIVSIAVIGARLLPVAFLCPLLGGQSAPTTVKLGLILALSSFLHAAGGIEAPPVESTLMLMVLVVKELALGTTVGLVASLPFDAARMGGRFTDLFRGSSAEAVLPVTGTKESAAGDGLFQLLLALSTTSVVMPMLLSSLFRSFLAVAPGTFIHSEDVVFEATRLVGAAFATGLALGAPLAGASLAVDALVGLASRALPQMNLQETAAPLRILGGGAVLWLSVGVMTERLLAEAVATPDAIRLMLEAAP